MDQKKGLEFTITCVGQKRSGSLGKMQFPVVPATGEFILKRNGGEEEFYRVKAVVHTLGEFTTAGDLFVEFYGGTAEFHAFLLLQPS